MVKLGSPRKISSKLAEEQNGLFFYSYPAASDLLFLPTSTPQHQLFFCEFDWVFEKKEKKKACILSPRINSGGNTILEVLVASNLRQFAHLLQQIAAGTSDIRSSPPQLSIELRFAACGGV